MDGHCARAIAARSIARRGAVAALLVTATMLLASCAPAAAGSVTVRPVDRDGVWVVSVPATGVGRSVLVRHSVFRSVTIPRGFVPPPGTCRIWHADRSPALQPPFGDCPALERRVPVGAYLIYG